jgi:hypothetical protein
LIRGLANIANSISFVHGSKNKLLVDGKRNSQTQTGPVEILEREWKKGSSKYLGLSGLAGPDTGPRANLEVVGD